VVEDCRSSIQQMASSVEANRRRHVELEKQFQKLRDARLEDLYSVSGQRSQLPDAPAPARFMSVPSLGKVSEHVDGLTKSSQPRSQPTDRLPAASQTTSSISDETDFPTAPKREKGEQDKDTHAQETTLPADNIPASLDTSKASLPLNEQEMPLEVAKTTYYSQTTFRPIDDVEVVLKTFEPLAAKQKIRETTEVIAVLLADINDIDCFSGFDQRLPDATFLKSDDETFFTGNLRTDIHIDSNAGTREVIWLESSELSLDDFERLVDRVAEKVRPFPVIGFDPRTNTIMAVHDQHFVSYNAAPIQSASGSSSKSGTVGSSSNCQRTTSVSPTNSSSATSVGGGTYRGSGKDVSPPPPPPPVSGEDPEDQLSLSAACNICPFSGVFTIEDQAHHEQCVKITFCLRINSSVNGRRILTTTALTDFSLSLPAPGELQEPSSRDPLSPYFVCNELQIAIGPDSEQISECEPRSRTPKGRWDVKKVSRSSGLGGITVALAFLPSVQLPVSKKNGLAVDLDPISQYIDFKLAKSYEVRKTREHLWKYPLRKDRPKDNDLELPAHSSELGYRTSVNVESIHARVTATHVVDPKSRTANKLKRQNVEERRRRRAQSQPFKFEGDSKHLILQFTVTVKKRDGERFLQFEGPGVERSLYHKVGSHCSRREHAANTREQSPPDRRNSSESEDVSQAEGMLSMKWAK